MTHHRRILLYALLGPLPAVLATCILLWSEPHSANVRNTVLLLVLATWLGSVAALYARTLRPIQTAANLLSALREGDFSIRARGRRDEDPLAELYWEINQLGSLLRSQRLSAMEATALVQAVMEAIDIAVFAFDEEGMLRLANPAAQKLLGTPVEKLLGRHASELGLAECLEGSPSRLLANTTFPNHPGRWGLRRSSFREQGRPHNLVVLADLSQPLRAEEASAWQRLVRVLGHELNNSLAPIKSIAGSLAGLCRRSPRPADWEDDLRSGLEVIAGRADNLSRFMHAYSRLARLPAPVRQPVPLAGLASGAAALETRIRILHTPGPDCVLPCDSSQVEQLLINLLRNAADACLEAAHGEVSPDAAISITWTVADGFAALQITDTGPGLPSSANLFVPFFTTKPQGSGIGLVLSRQIAENHGGSLELRNRSDGHPGCTATLRLPLA